MTSNRIPSQRASAIEEIIAARKGESPATTSPADEIDADGTTAATEGTWPEERISIDWPQVLDAHRNSLSIPFCITCNADWVALRERLAKAFFRYEHVFRSATAALSEPAQRNELLSLVEAGEFDRKAFDALNPATRIRLTILYQGPEGRALYDSDTIDTAAFRKAVRDAIAGFPEPRKGRPHWTDNLALRQFSLEVACIGPARKLTFKRQVIGVRADSGSRRSSGPPRDSISSTPGRERDRYEYSGTVIDALSLLIPLLPGADHIRADSSYHADLARRDLKANRKRLAAWQQTAPGERGPQPVVWLLPEALWIA